MRYLHRKQLRRSIQIGCLIALQGLLISCSSEEKASELEIAQFEAYYSHAITQKYRGDSFIADLREVAADRSNPNAQARIDPMLIATGEIDMEIEKTLQLIRSEKKAVLKILGCQDALPETLRKDKPSRIRAEGLMGDAEDHYQPQVVLSRMIKTRDTIAQKVASSHVKRSDKHDGMYICDSGFRYDPITLNAISNLKSDEQRFRAACKNASLDDEQMLVEILMELTPRQGENKKLSAREALHFLSILEGRILSARAMALATIRVRISSHYGSFDSIRSFIEGPNVVEKGETFELEIGIAAYDSTKNPLITSEIGSVEPSKDGVGKVTLSLDKTTTIRGMVGIKNKAGVMKTLEWKKTIVVQ